MLIKDIAMGFTVYQITDLERAILLDVLRAGDFKGMIGCPEKDAISLLIQGGFHEDIHGIQDVIKWLTDTYDLLCKAETILAETTTKISECRPEHKQ